MKIGDNVKYIGRPGTYMGIKPGEIGNIIGELEPDVDYPVFLVEFLPQHEVIKMTMDDLELV